MTQEIKAPVAIDPVDASDVILRAVMNRDAVKAMTHEELVSDDLWVYSCALNRRHIGIVFTRDPASMGEIHGGLWTACYRPRGDAAFWGAAEEVICMQCFVERGEKVPLRIAEVRASNPRLGLCFTLPRTWRERYARKESRKELAKWLPKSESQPEKEVPDAGRKQQPAVAAAAGKPAG